MRRVCCKEASAMVVLLCGKNTFGPDEPGGFYYPFGLGNDGTKFIGFYMPTKEHRIEVFRWAALGEPDNETCWGNRPAPPDAENYRTWQAWSPEKFTNVEWLIEQQLKTP